MSLTHNKRENLQPVRARIHTGHSCDLLPACVCVGFCWFRFRLDHLALHDYPRLGQSVSQSVRGGWLGLARPSQTDGRCRPSIHLCMSSFRLSVRPFVCLCESLMQGNEGNQQGSMMAYTVRNTRTVPSLHTYTHTYAYPTLHTHSLPSHIPVHPSTHTTPTRFLSCLQVPGKVT